MQSLRWQVSLPTIGRASFAGADDLCGILHHHGPIEALTEGVPDQGLGRGMVPAHPGVDIAQELLSLIDQDALLEYHRGALMIQLPVDDDV